MADEIINARVKQKVDTEENWLANPLILLEGEQGFVWTDDDPNQPVNFKIGDGTKTFAELPYFIAYYSNVISHKIIRMPNVSLAQSISGIFNSNTNLYDVVISNIGGDPVTLKIGTTDGGSEIGEYDLVAGVNVLDIKYMFDSTETVYFSGFDGNELSLIIIYFNYAENPVIPPSGSEPTPFRWPRNFMGMFVPTGVGQLEACFDMITGMGVPGSLYENCQLCNSLNGFINMDDSYAIGYKTGVSIGDDIGSNSFTIVNNNLPEHKHNMFTSSLSIGDLTGDNPVAYQKNSGINRDYIMSNGTGYVNRGVTSNSGGVTTPTPIDNRPKSKYVLYFLAITD